MADEHDVRRIALSLADVVEDGELSFRVHGRQFVSQYPERVHPKKARVPRKDILVMLVDDVEEKNALLEGEPDVFFTTAHYDGSALVLVRLEQIDEARLAELLVDAHAAAIARGPVRKRTRRTL